MIASSRFLVLHLFSLCHEACQFLSIPTCPSPPNHCLCQLIVWWFYDLSLYKWVITIHNTWTVSVEVIILISDSVCYLFIGTYFESFIKSKNFSSCLKYIYFNYFVSINSFMFLFWHKIYYICCKCIWKLTNTNWLLVWFSISKDFFFFFKLCFLWFLLKYSLIACLLFSFWT